MEQARTATAADVAILTTMSESARRDLVGQRGGALLIDTIVGQGRSLEQAVIDALEDDDRLVVLGTLDGVEVGFATARCEAVGDHQLGTIESIYVEPSGREVGVGEAMVDAIMDWCAGRGCGGIDAPALPGSRPAKAFFEEHGFVARLLVMHRALPEPSTGDRD